MTVIFHTYQTLLQFVSSKGPFEKKILMGSTFRSNENAKQNTNAFIKRSGTLGRYVHKLQRTAIFPSYFNPFIIHENFKIRILKNCNG